jgi:hypothetical protein
MRGTYQVKSQKSKVKSVKREGGQGGQMPNAQCPMPNAQ